MAGKNVNQTQSKAKIILKRLKKIDCYRDEIEN